MLQFVFYNQDGSIINFKIFRNIDRLESYLLTQWEEEEVQVIIEFGHIITEEGTYEVQEVEVL